MKIAENQIKTLKESFELLKKNPVYLVVPVLVEMIFLFLLGFFGSLILNKSVPYLQQIAEIRMSSGGTSLDDYGSSMLMQQMQLTPLVSKVLVIFAQLALFILVIWIIFKGINWFLAARCVDNKVSLKKYFPNFAFVTISGFVLFLIIGIFYYYANLKSVLSINAPFIQYFINMTTIVLCLIASYFLFISTAICHKYKIKEICRITMKKGIKDFKKIITAYIMIVILFIIANYIVKLLSFRFEAMLVAGVIFVLPLIGYSRVFLIKTIS
jgi:hypothetical protein